jgi:hypothetical protein
MHAMNDKPYIDDGVLDKLAECVDIPPDQRDRFRRCTRAWIKRLWREVAPSAIRTPRIMSDLAEYQKAIKKVRMLFTPTEQWEAMECAETLTLTHLSGAGKGDRLREFLESGNLLLHDLDSAIERAKFRTRGYKPTAKTAVDDFPCHLIVIIKGLGGWVTTSRTMQGSPTHLSKALDILKPYLPPGVTYTAKACEIAGTKVNGSQSLIAQEAIKAARRPSMRRSNSTSPTQEAARNGAMKR